MCDCFQRSIFGNVQQIKGEQGLPGNGFLIDINGNLDAGGRKITNIADGSSAQDVLSKTQVTINNANTEENLLNTKGDIFVYDSIQAKIVKKPVGLDGQSLVADITQNDGLNWSNANINDTLILDSVNQDIKLSRSAVKTLLVTDHAGGDATLEVNSIKTDIISERTPTANIRFNSKLEIFDANNTMQVVNGNPRWTFDGGDFLEFDRTSGINNFGVLTIRINGAPNPELSVEQTTVTVNNILNIVDTNTSISKTTTGPDANDVTFQYGDNLGITKLFYDDSNPSLLYVKGINRLNITELGIILNPIDNNESPLASHQTHNQSITWNGLDLNQTGDIDIEKIGNVVTIKFQTISGEITIIDHVISSDISTPLATRFRPTVTQHLNAIVQKNGSSKPGRVRVMSTGEMIFDIEVGDTYRTFVDGFGNTAGFEDQTITYII